MSKTFLERKSLTKVLVLKKAGEFKMMPVIATYVLNDLVNEIFAFGSFDHPMTIFFDHGEHRRFQTRVDILSRIQDETAIFFINLVSHGVPVHEKYS